MNEILDLSRIEAGRIDLEPEAVDLGELVGKCITSVAPLVKPEVGKGTTFTMRIGDESSMENGHFMRRNMQDLLYQGNSGTDPGQQVYRACGRQRLLLRAS